MLNNVLVVSSPTSEGDKNQASITYLATILNKLNINFDILDLSGTMDYFNPPQEFFSSCDSEYWLSPFIFHEATWLDDFLPNSYAEFDAVFYSSLFSPDILIHGRHSLNQKKRYPRCMSIIGGAAVSCLNNRQLSVLSEVFDHQCIGYDIEYLINAVMGKIKSSNVGLIRTYDLCKIQPNYELTNVKPFITVYSGHGCNWGKCNYCSSARLSTQEYYCRPVAEISDDLDKIAKLTSENSEVMLSSDSFTKKDLMDLAVCLKRNKLNVPYNIMLRGERWVTEGIGHLLSESGCTDVFIGAEALNDEILKILNKGLDTRNIVNAIENLSKYVNVIMGLILFIPSVTEKQLDEQLATIEKILPYVSGIEPEILSVMYETGFGISPEKYGIKLWVTRNNINDSWCYGLSPDIPWTFDNNKEVNMWFKYYDKLKKLIDAFVQPIYWDSIDYVRLRF